MPVIRGQGKAEKRRPHPKGMRDASRIINAPMPGCQEGGGDTLLPAVEADPPDTVIWGVYLGDIHAAGAVLADPRGIDNTVGRIDPPMQARLVGPRGLDIVDESTPGCLEGGEDTPACC